MGGPRPMPAPRPLVLDTPVTTKYKRQTYDQVAQYAELESGRLDRRVTPSDVIREAVESVVPTWIKEHHRLPRAVKAKTPTRKKAAK